MLPHLFAHRLDAEVAKLRSRIELLNEGGGATASTLGTGDAPGNLGGGTHDPAHKVVRPHDGAFHFAPQMLCPIFTRSVFLE
jgi:hypothetical protein